MSVGANFIRKSKCLIRLKDLFHHPYSMPDAGSSIKILYEVSISAEDWVLPYH